jgi:AdoMet-dependent heme synthase
MKFLKFPIMIGWAITNKCNLKCLYCSQDSGKNLNNELTTKQCLEVINKITKYKPSVIGYTGGEPFLKKDFEKIVSYSSSKGIRNVVTTNGLIIDDIHRGFLVKFIKIRISLDSSNEDKHNYLRQNESVFQQVLNTIDRIKNLGIKTEIVTTISKKNMNSLDSLFYLLKELKVDEWSLSFFCPIGRGSELESWVLSPVEYKYVVDKLISFKNNSTIHIKTDIPQLALIKEQVSNIPHYCSAGNDLIVILPDGSLAPCFSLPLTDGNILSDDIYEIWNTSKLFNSFRDKSLITGNCGKCEYLNSCGGCRAMAYALENDLFKGDPLCWKN